MKKLDRLPQVGEIFGINAKCISSFVVIDNDRHNRNVYQNKKNRGISCTNDIRSEEFDKKIDYDYGLNTESILEDKILLLKYLGNGICEEYYTCKLIRFAIPSLKDEITTIREQSSRGPKEFMESFNIVSEDPLVYYVDDINKGYGYIIDDDFKLNFYKNIGFENGIIHALDRLENQAKQHLLKQKEQLVEEDYPYACVENAIYDLEQKTKKYQA